MDRSRCKRGPCQSSPSKVAKGRVCSCARSTRSKNLTGRDTSCNSPADVLRGLFSKSRRSLWFTVLPRDNDVGDMVSAFDIDWEVLLPILIAERLIVAKVTSLVKSYSISFTRFREFSTGLNSLLDDNQAIMEVTRCITCVDTRNEYYFCIGKPKYRSPCVQMAELTNATRRSPLKKMLERVEGVGCPTWLKDQAKQVSNELCSSSLYCRILSKQKDIEGGGGRYDTNFAETNEKKIDGFKKAAT